MSILLLGGSPSDPSSTNRLLRHIGDKLDLLGHRHSELQVRDLPAQALLHADFSDPAIVHARALVAEADALVIATPVYKASYTGILKAFLDLLPQDGLKGKLVLPVATGGSQSHMLALDYALRPVLHALDAKHVLTSIYATSEQLVLGEDGLLVPHAAIALRIADGVDHLSACLHALPGRRAAAPVTSIAASIGSVTSVARSGATAAVPARTLKDFPYTQDSRTA